MERPARVAATLALLLAAGVARAETDAPVEVAGGVAPGAARRPSGSEDGAPSTLGREEFGRAVLAANPEIDAASAAVEAARASEVAAGGWPGPAIAVAVAPLTTAPGGMEVGGSLRLAQALPAGGELRARAAVASARTEGRLAARDGVALDLALEALLAWDAWHGVHAELATIEEHALLLEGLRAAATSGYAAGRSRADAPLSAALALARLEQERVGTEAERAAIQAEMNGLLHRDPETALPAPASPGSGLAEAVAGNAGDGAMPGASEAAARAASTAGQLGSHPALREIDAAADEARADLAMARAGRWPMVGVMVSYESMRELEGRLMAGIELGLPALPGAGRASLDAARAGIDGTASARAAIQDRLRAQEAAARARLESAVRSARVAKESVLPLARERLAVLEAGLSAGVADFDALLEAAGELLDAELDLDRSLVRVLDAQARLDHAMGLVPGGSRHMEDP